MVRLINNKKREILLGESHALRLLNMSNNGGWRLHRDSGYKFENDELRKDKAALTRKEKKRDNKQSDSTPEPDKVSRGEQDNA